LTLPVSVDESLSYYFEGYNYGNVELTVEPEDQQTIDQVLGISADTNSLTGEPLPAPASVSVSVLDGTGLYDQASSIGSALQAEGFQLSGEGTAPSQNAQSETVVTYTAGDPGSEAAAQLVARSLTGPVVLTPGQTADGAQVTVVTGAQLAVVAPPQPVVVVPATHHKARPGGAPTTTTTSSATTSTVPGATTSTVPGATTTTTAPGATTTTTAPVTADGFAPPTSARESLAEFDPRSCTPSGGEGS